MICLPSSRWWHPSQHSLCVIPRYKDGSSRWMMKDMLAALLFLICAGSENLRGFNLLPTPNILNISSHCSISISINDCVSSINVCSKHTMSSSESLSAVEESLRHRQTTPKARSAPVPFWFKLSRKVHSACLVATIGLTGNSSQSAANTPLNSTSPQRSSKLRAGNSTEEEL